MPKAVWRGSTGGFGGLEKGRAALLNLGMSRPDLIDSGVLDWDYERYGPDEGRLKEKMEFGHQVLHYSTSGSVIGVAPCVRPYAHTSRHCEYQVPHSDSGCRGRCQEVKVRC